MSASNGATSTATTAENPQQQQQMPRDPYRPDADMAKVYVTIEQSLKEIVWEAAHQATGYISLASPHYGDSAPARYGHLVDAAECLEIAMTHLGLLRSALAYRLCIEDDQNIATDTDNSIDTVSAF